MAFLLGRFTLHALREATFALDGGAMFGIVPKPLWERSFPPDDLNRVGLAARCLLVVDGARRFLIDTGIGDRWDGKQRAQFAIEREGIGLDAELARVGCTREDVTDVVLTHLHFDHCGGTFREGHAGPALAFPKAVHHLQRRNWSWAQRPTDRDRGSFRAADFEQLEASGRLNLLDGPTELAPGLQLWLSEGHTEGLQLVRISDGDASLVFCGDLIPTTGHLKPSWGMAYDLRPLVVVEEKRMLLAQAVEDQSILFFEHDPKVAACTVKDVAGRVEVDQVVPL